MITTAEAAVGVLMNYNESNLHSMCQDLVSDMPQN